MLTYRFLRTFIVCGIVIIFAAGCRVPTIISPTGDKTIQAGSSISFEAESYPDAIYKWTFDGGADDVYGRNPKVKFNKAGVYDVCLIVVFNDFESGYAELKVTVNGPSYGEALVAKTGQTKSYRTGDDGDEQAGVTWPNPRFTDNSDGTVTDNLTGLIWLKQADYNSISGGRGTATWNEAVDFCDALEDGYCGLSDGSSAGDWRLPNVKELQSLIHYRYQNPALPNTAGTGRWAPGDPFNNVQYGSGGRGGAYWTATTSINATDEAWAVLMSIGYVAPPEKTNSYYVWPVRAGDRR